MEKVKINKKGQITIPKKLRDKYSISPDVTLTIKDNDGKFTIEPLNFCHTCKKALPDGAECPNCPPPETIYIY